MKNSLSKRDIPNVEKIIEVVDSVLAHQAEEKVLSPHTATRDPTSSSSLSSWEKALVKRRRLWSSFCALWWRMNALQKWHLFSYIAEDPLEKLQQLFLYLVDSLQEFLLYPHLFLPLPSGAPAVLGTASPLLKSAKLDVLSQLHGDGLLPLQHRWCQRSLCSTMLCSERDGSALFHHNCTYLVKKRHLHWMTDLYVSFCDDVHGRCQQRSLYLPPFPSSTVGLGGRPASRSEWQGNTTSTTDGSTSPPPSSATTSSAEAAPLDRKMHAAMSWTARHAIQRRRARHHPTPYALFGSFSSLLAPAAMQERDTQNGKKAPHGVRSSTAETATVEMPHHSAQESRGTDPCVSSLSSFFSSSSPPPTGMVILTSHAEALQSLLYTLLACCDHPGCSHELLYSEPNPCVVSLLYGIRHRLSAGVSLSLFETEEIVRMMEEEGPHDEEKEELPNQDPNENGAVRKEQESKTERHDTWGPAPLTPSTPPPFPSTVWSTRAEEGVEVESTASTTWSWSHDGTASTPPPPLRASITADRHPALPRVGKSPPREKGESGGGAWRANTDAPMVFPLASIPFKKRQPPSRYFHTWSGEEGKVDTLSPSSSCAAPLSSISRRGGVAPTLASHATERTKGGEVGAVSSSLSSVSWFELLFAMLQRCRESVYSHLVCLALDVVVEAVTTQQKYDHWAVLPTISSFALLCAKFLSECPLSFSSSAEDVVSRPSEIAIKKAATTTVPAAPEEEEKKKRERGGSRRRASKERMGPVVSSPPPLVSASLFPLRLLAPIIPTRRGEREGGETLLLPSPDGPPSSSLSGEEEERMWCEAVIACDHAVSMYESMSLLIQVITAIASGIRPWSPSPSTTVDPPSSSSHLHTRADVFSTSKKDAKERQAEKGSQPSTARSGEEGKWASDRRPLCQGDDAVGERPSFPTPHTWRTPRASPPPSPLGHRIPRGASPIRAEAGVASKGDAGPHPRPSAAPPPASTTRSTLWWKRKASRHVDSRSHPHVVPRCSPPPLSTVADGRGGGASSARPSSTSVVHPSRCGQEEDEELPRHSSHALSSSRAPVHAEELETSLYALQHAREQFFLSLLRSNLLQHLDVLLRTRHPLFAVDMQRRVLRALRECCRLDDPSPGGLRGGRSPARRVGAEINPTRGPGLVMDGEVQGGYGAGGGRPVVTSRGSSPHVGKSGGGSGVPLPSLLSQDLPVPSPSMSHGGARTGVDGPSSAFPPSGSSSASSFTTTTTTGMGIPWVSSMAYESIMPMDYREGMRGMTPPSATPTPFSYPISPSVLPLFGRSGGGGSTCTSMASSVESSGGGLGGAALVRPMRATTTTLRETDEEEGISGEHRNGNKKKSGTSRGGAQHGAPSVVPPSSALPRWGSSESLLWGSSFTATTLPPMLPPPPPPSGEWSPTSLLVQAPEVVTPGWRQVPAYVQLVDHVVTYMLNAATTPMGDSFLLANEEEQEGGGEGCGSIRSPLSPSSASSSSSFPTTLQRSPIRLERHAGSQDDEACPKKDDQDQRGTAVGSTHRDPIPLPTPPVTSSEEEPARKSGMERAGLVVLPSAPTSSTFAVPPLWGWSSSTVEFARRLHILWEAAEVVLLDPTSFHLFHGSVVLEQCLTLLLEGFQGAYGKEEEERWNRNSKSRRSKKRRRHKERERQRNQDKMDVIMRQKNMATDRIEEEPVSPVVRSSLPASPLLSSHTRKRPPPHLPSPPSSPRMATSRFTEEVKVFLPAWCLLCCRGIERAFLEYCIPLSSTHVALIAEILLFLLPSSTTAAAGSTSFTGLPLPRHPFAPPSAWPSISCGFSVISSVGGGCAWREWVFTRWLYLWNASLSYGMEKDRKGTRSIDIFFTLLERFQSAHQMPQDAPGFLDSIKARAQGILPTPPPQPQPPPSPLSSSLSSGSPVPPTAGRAGTAVPSTSPMGGPHSLISSTRLKEAGSSVSGSGGEERFPLSSGGTRTGGVGHGAITRRNSMAAHPYVQGGGGGGGGVVDPVALNTNAVDCVHASELTNIILKSIFTSLLERNPLLFTEPLAELLLKLMREPDPNLSRLGRWCIHASLEWRESHGAYAKALRHCYAHDILGLASVVGDVTTAPKRGSPTIITTTSSSSGRETSSGVDDTSIPSSVPVPGTKAIADDTLGERSIAEKKKRTAAQEAWTTIVLLLHILSRHLNPDTVGSSDVLFERRLWLHEEGVVMAVVELLAGLLEEEKQPIFSAIAGAAATATTTGTSTATMGGGGTPLGSMEKWRQMIPVIFRFLTTFEPPHPISPQLADTPFVSLLHARLSRLHGGVVEHWYWIIFCLLAALGKFPRIPVSTIMERGGGGDATRKPSGNTSGAYERTARRPLSTSTSPAGGSTAVSSASSSSPAVSRKSDTSEQSPEERPLLQGKEQEETASITPWRQAEMGCSSFMWVRDLEPFLSLLEHYNGVADRPIFLDLIPASALYLKEHGPPLYHHLVEKILPQLFQATGASVFTSSSIIQFVLSQSLTSLYPSLSLSHETIQSLPFHGSPAALEAFWLPMLERAPLRSALRFVEHGGMMITLGALPPRGLSFSAVLRFDDLYPVMTLCELQAVGWRSSRVRLVVLDGDTMQLVQETPDGSSLSKPTATHPSTSSSGGAGSTLSTSPPSPPPPPPSGRAAAVATSTRTSEATTAVKSSGKEGGSGGTVPTTSSTLPTPTRVTLNEKHGLLHFLPRCWMYLTVVFTIARTITVYLNGVKVGSGSVPLFVPSAGMILRLGLLDNPPFPQATFALSEVTVWAEELTWRQVEAAMAGIDPSAAQSTKLHYREVAYLGDSLPGFLSGEGGGGAAGRGGGRGRGQGIGCGGKVYDANPSMVANPIDDRIAHFVAHETESELFINLSASPPASTSHCDSMNSSGNAGSSIPQTSSSSIPVTSRGEEGTPFRPPIVAKMVGRYTTPPKRWVDYHLLWSSHGGLFRLLEWLPHVRDSDHLLRLLSVFATAVRHVTNFYTMDARLYVLLAQQLSLFCGRYITTEVADKLLFAAATRPTDVDGFRMSSILVNRLVLLYVLCDAGVYREMPLHVALYMFQQMQRSFFDPQQCAFAARNIHFADPVVLTDSMLQAAVQLAVQHAPIRLVYAAMQCAKQILLVCPEHVGVMDAFTSLSAALTPVEKRVQLPFLFPAEKPPALSPTPLRPSAVLNNANGKSETVEVKKTDDTTDRNEEGKEGEGEGYNTPSSPLSSPSVKEDLPRPSSSCASSPSSTVAMPPFWLTLRLPCCSTAISPHAVPHLPLRLQRHLSYLLLATLLECRNSPISRPFHLSLSRCVSLSWYITCLSSFTLPASVLAATRLFLDVARQSPSLQQELEFHQSTVVQALRPHAWCEDLPLLLLAMAIGAHDRIELLSSRCPLLEQLEIHHMHWNTSPPGSSVAGGGMSLGVIIASLCLDVLVLFLQSIMDEAHQLPNLGRHAFLCAAHQRLQEQGKRGDVGSGGGSNYPLHYSSTTIKMMMAAASSFSSPSTTPRRLPPHRVFSVGEDTRLPPSATATPTKALTAVSYYMQLPWVSYRFRRVISVVRSSARLMMSVNRRRYIRGRGGRVGYTSGPSLALPLLLPLPSPASPRPAQREKEGDASATTSASYPASSSRSPSVFASTPSPSIAWQRKVKSCPRGKPGEDSLVWWQATFEKKREPPQDDAGVLGPEGTASTLTSEVSLSSLVHSEPNEKDGETKVERRATKEEKVEEGVPSITASASSLVASMRHRSSVAVLHTVTILWLSILKKRYAPLYVSPGTFDARPLFSATSPSAARQPNPGRPPREEGWNTHPIAPSYEDRLPPGEGVEEEGNLTVASHSFSSLLPVSSLSASVKSQHSKKEQGTSMLLDPPSTAAPPVKPADGAAKAAKGSLPFLSYPVVGEEWGKTLDRLLSLPSSSASPTQHPEELAEKQLVYRVLRCFHGITSQPRYYALFVSSPFQSVAWGSLFRFVSISRMHSMVRAFDQRMLQYVYPREERKRNVSSLPSVKEKKREPQGKRNHSLSSSGPATSQSGRSDPDMSRESSPAHVPSLGTALSTKEENPVVETTSVLEGSTTHTASSPIERDISSPHARSSPPLPLPPPSMAMSTPASRCGSPTSGGDGRDDALLPISSHLSFHMMGMEDREGLTSLGSSPPPPPQTLLGTPGSSVGSGHGGSALPRPTSSSPTPSPVTTVWPTTAESEVLPTALGSALQDAVLLPTSGSFSSSSSASSPSPPYTCAKESQRAMTESLSLCMPVSERRRDDSNRETMSLLPPPLLLPQKEELEERGREASEIVQGGSPLPPGIFSSSRASTPVSRGNGGSPSPSPSPLRGLPTASSSTTKEDAGETEATRVVSCASTVTALPTTLPTDVDDDRARTPHPDPGEASDAASQTHAAEEKKIQHGRTSLADTSLSSLFPSASSSLPQIPLFVGQGTTSSLAPSTAVAANAETSPKRGTVAEKEEDMEADAVLDPISKTWRAIRMAMGERTRREAFHMLDTLIEVSLYASPPMWSTSTQYYDQQQQHHHRPPSHKKDVSTGGGGGEERYSGMLYPSTMASSTSSAAAAGASAAFSAGGFASRKEMGGGEKGTSASGGGGAAGTTGGAGISSEWVGGVPYGACGGLLFHLLFITSSTASNPCTAGHLITYFLFKVASFVQQVFPPPFLETATPENPVGPLSRTAGTHREEERLSSYYAASEDLDRSKSTESSPSSSPTQIDPRSSREEPSSWRTSLPTSTFHSAKRGSEPGEKVDNRGRSRGRRSSSRSCFPGCTRDLSPTTRERYAASTTSNIREARRYASTCLHNIVGLTQLLSAMIAVNAVTLTQVRAFFIALLTSAQSWSEESSVLAVQRCVLMACATTLQKPSLVGLPDGMERLHTICLLFQLALTPNSGRNGMIESLFYGLYTTLHKTPAPTWLSPASVTHRHRVLVRMMRIVLTVYVVGTRPGYPLPSALWKHVSPVYAVGAIPPSDTGRQSYGGRPSGFLAASTDTTMSPTTATGRLSGGVVNTLAGLARFPMTPSTASATGEKPVLVKHPLLELMVSQWLLGGGFRTAVTPVTWTAAKAQEEDEGEEGKQEEVEKAEEGSPCPSFSTSHAPFHASGADHRHSHTTNETTSTSTVEEEMNEEDLLYIQLCQVLQEHNQALENFASGKTKNLLELCNKEERATRAVYVEKLRVCSQQYSIVLAKSTSTSSTSSSSFPQQSSSRGGGASTTSSSSVASVPPSTFSSGAISLPLVEEISMHYLQRFGSYIDTDLPFFYPSEEPLRERGGGGGEREGLSPLQRERAQCGSQRRRQKVVNG